MTKKKIIIFYIVYTLLLLTIVGCMCASHINHHPIDDITTTESNNTTSNIVEAIETIETIESPETTIIEATETTETETTEIEDSTTVEIETDKEVDTIIETNIKEDSTTFHLSDYERWVAECIVMGESGGEPYEGQILVAQCLLNACLKDGLQPSEVRIKYKYSGWKENPTSKVKDAVSKVFDEGYKVTEEFILYFYAPKYAKGTWHETQIFVIELGGHRFFKEKNS